MFCAPALIVHSFPSEFYGLNFIDPAADSGVGLLHLVKITLSRHNPFSAYLIQGWQSKHDEHLHGLEKPDVHRDVAHKLMWNSASRLLYWCKTIKLKEILFDIFEWTES